MARVNTVTQQVVPAGLVPSFAVAPTAEGDVVDCGDDVFVWVVNGAGAPINVTVQAVATQDGLDVADRVVAVADGTQALIGPLPRRTFARSSGADVGRAYVDYSSVTSITRAVVRI